MNLLSQPHHCLQGLGNMRRNAYASHVSLSRAPQGLSPLHQPRIPRGARLSPRDDATTRRSRIRGRDTSVGHQTLTCGSREECSCARRVSFSGWFLGRCPSSTQWRGPQTTPTVDVFGLCFESSCFLPGRASQWYPGILVVYPMSFMVYSLESLETCWDPSPRSGASKFESRLDQQGFSESRHKPGTMLI